MKQHIISPEVFMAVFGKFDFEIQHITKNQIIAVAKGDTPNTGIYLEILNDTFSLEYFLNPIYTWIFHLQHFDNVKEIEDLILKIQIILKKTPEISRLAVHTSLVD